MTPVAIYPKTCGIYFLWQDGQIVYVGQSADVMFRIYTHANEGKKAFDSFSFSECLPEDMTRLEMEAILQHRPILNTIVPAGGSYLNTWPS